MFARPLTIWVPHGYFMGKPIVVVVVSVVVVVGVVVVAVVVTVGLA